MNNITNAENFKLTKDIEVLRYYIIQERGSGILDTEDTEAQEISDMFLEVTGNWLLIPPSKQEDFPEFKSIVIDLVALIKQGSSSIPAIPLAYK